MLDAGSNSRDRSGYSPQVLEYAPGPMPPTARDILSRTAIILVGVLFGWALTAGCVFCLLTVATVLPSQPLRMAGIRISGAILLTGALIFARVFFRHRNLGEWLMMSFLAGAAACFAVAGLGLLFF
jgi:hypothetical protein